MHARCERRAPRSGRSLPHVAAVIVVVGVIAIAVAPHVNSAGLQGEIAVLRSRLKELRDQIDLYRFQHNGDLPAAGSESEREFLTAMLCTTRSDGSTSGRLEPLVIGDEPYGPYFETKLPENPVNQRRNVVVTADPAPVADGSSGWWYCSTTGELRANLAGRGDAGTL